MPLSNHKSAQPVLACNLKHKIKDIFNTFGITLPCDEDVTMFHCPSLAQQHSGWAALVWHSLPASEQSTGRALNTEEQNKAHEERRKKQDSSSTLPRIITCMGVELCDWSERRYQYDKHNPGHITRISPLFPAKPKLYLIRQGEPECNIYKHMPATSEITAQKAWDKDSVLSHHEDSVLSHHDQMKISSHWMRNLCYTTSISNTI